MRVVVIGGTGHIGSYLTPLLAQVGCDVICVSRQQRKPYFPNDTWAKVQFETIDRDLREKEGIFGDDIARLAPDVVIDLTCFRLESARQLVEALQSRVEHFLHCGTIWVHGPSTEVPTRESDGTPPICEYGTQKKQIETYLLQQARHGAFPAVVLHPGHLVGVGWEPINPAGNRNLDLFRSIALGEEVRLPNLGMETLQHVHCADVAAAFVAGMVRRDESIGQSFHVVASRAVTLRGYAANVAGWFGQELHAVYLPWDDWRKTVSETDAALTWDHLIHSPNCSMEKAERLLGFVPKYSSLTAVRESVEWLVATGHLQI
jgi:nucleoside-diphosphate-sugar epimerase